MQAMARILYAFIFAICALLNEISSFSQSPLKTASVRRRLSVKNNQVLLMGLDTEEKPVNLMTLTRFMIEATRTNPDHADLESLLNSIQMACKTISMLVRRAEVNDLTGANNLKNKRLDKIANSVLKNSLRFTGKIGVIASEEDDRPALIEEAYNSQYVAIFDPLDGFSNIGAGISTGTIFGIYKENEYCLLDNDETMNSAEEQCLLQSLRPASNLVASGYCMYSSSTIMMITLGEGVFGFTLDPNNGEFVLTHPNVRIPRRGKIYSFNDAKSLQWSKGLQNYMADLKSGKSETPGPYSSRYIGSMVGDVHRTLLYGGIFGYPADDLSPEGKLRLVYESAPMSFLVEQAGGRSSNGKASIMDISPTSLNQRIQTFLGSYEDVVELEKYLKED